MNINIGTETWLTIPIFGGIPITDAVVVSWIVSVIIITFALIVRYILLPKFEDVPKGFQSLIELFVEWVYHFCEDTLHEKGRELAPYIGTLALYLGLANIIELVGLKPPTTNLATTFALAIMTFPVKLLWYKEKRCLREVKRFSQTRSHNGTHKFYY